MGLTRCSCCYDHQTSTSTTPRRQSSTTPCMCNDDHTLSTPVYDKSPLRQNPSARIHFGRHSTVLRATPVCMFFKVCLDVINGHKPRKKENGKHGSKSDWLAARRCDQCATLPANHRCAVGLMPLLREEFGLHKLILHSELRRRAASRRDLPCPSSWQSLAALVCI